MKKFLTYVTGIYMAAALYGCSSENDIVVETDSCKVSASRSLSSRTELQDDSKTILWSSGDRIYLVGDGGGSYAMMDLVEGENEGTATFEGNVVGSLSEIDKALYPIPAKNGNEYAFDFPANRTWSANSAAPMIGDFDYASKHVQFRNLAALVRIYLDGNDYDENNTLVLTMEGSAISGTATVDVASGSLVIADGGNEVKVTEFGNAEFVDIPVPAGTYTGYTVKLDNEVIAESTESKSLKQDDVAIIGKVSEDGDIDRDADDAYLIQSLADLLWLAEEVNAGETFSKETIKLTTDINLANKPWTPIGNSVNKFQGTFDGQNHTISNLFVDMEGKSDVGLFGMTTNGEIKNLTVKNAKVTGRLNVGVVAGNPYTSKYTDIKVTGHVEVNGFSYVGGVGGKNAYANWTNVTVEVDEDSYVKANSVDGTAYRTYVGGVIGFNGEGVHSFTNIKSNIDVTGSTCDVGGLFGIAHYGNQFVNCTSSGDVEITNAAKAGDAEEMGGIAGVWNNNGSDVVFTDCSFTGTLKANITEGVDLSDNSIVGAAYSTDGSGKLIIDGKQVIANGVAIDSEGNYELSTAKAMFWFAEQVNEKGETFKGKSVKLTADIDLENQDWEPIGQTGATEFKGVFDGQNHTISNLNIDSEDEDGNHYSSALFGWLEGHGDDNEQIRIENVKVNGAKVNGHHNVATIAGYTTGNVTVSNCHVTGAIINCTYANEDAGGDKAGVVVGNGTAGSESGAITNCSATNSTVKAGRDAGQVVGACSESKVSGCTATNVVVSANGTGTGANIRNEIIGRLL